MDKLRDSLQDHRYVKFVPISKLFFRKYAYRIEVHLERYVTKKLANTYDFIRSARSRWDHGVKIAKSRCVDIAGTYKIRRQSEFCSFYFETEEDALIFIDHNKPFITQVVAPENEDEKSTLFHDQTVRIRNTLFWGKYRWTVRLRWMHQEDWLTLSESVKEAYPTVEGEEPRCVLEGGYPLKAYFNDPNDLLQFKFIAADHLYQIEKAVLREEILS